MQTSLTGRLKLEQEISVGPSVGNGNADVFRSLSRFILAVRYDNNQKLEPLPVFAPFKRPNLEGANAKATKRTR